MKPLPTLVEYGWLVTGPDRDVTYLAFVRLETEDGIWRVKQRVNLGRDEERAVAEHATEEAARAHLERIYAMGREYDGARWKVTKY